jgi:uncharacterized RDD family membrane protein YckC
LSENNIQENELLEEKGEDEAAVETIELHNEELTSKPSFMQSLLANIVDEAIIGLISIILLYLFDAILKISGYAVSQKTSILLIIFVIVSVIYRSIAEKMMSRNTIGKNLFKK